MTLDRISIPLRFCYGRDLNPKHVLLKYPRKRVCAARVATDMLVPS